MNRSRKLLLIAVALFSLTSRLNAQSADTLKRINRPEVVVTGFPTGAETPVPFEKIESAELRAVETVQDVPRVAAQSPSGFYYTYSGTDIGYSFINIRGFDQRRMSIMVNGVPQNDPEDHNVYWIDMPDLLSNTRTIQLERGGGNAFYGPPAIGGSINVETMMPAEGKVAVSGGFGSFNTRQYALSGATGLLNNEWALYGRISRTETDGYREASFDKLSSYYFSAAHYSDELTIQATAYGGPLEDGLNYYGVFPSPDRHELTDTGLRKANFRRPEEHEEFTQPHYQILSSWRVSPNVIWDNSLFYIHGSGFFDYDGTWPYGSHAEFFRLTPEYGARYGFTGVTDSLLGNELVRGFIGGDQYGWLPKLTIEHANGTLTTGLELRTYRSNHWGKLLSADITTKDFKTDYHYYDFRGGKDILSGYVSDLYSITPKIKALASLQILTQRYKVFDEQQYLVNGVWTSYSFTVPLTFLNPHLGLNYDLQDAGSLFASVAITTREPRLADYYNGEALTEPNFTKLSDGTFDFSQPNIKPERLTDLELGWRLTQNPDYSLGFTGYLMDFHDELIKTGRTDLFGQSIVANAEHARHYGFEIEAGLTVSEWLRFSANVTASSNKIIEFSKYVDPAAVAGKTPIGFPSFLASGSANITPLKNLSVILMGRYVGPFFGDILNTDANRNDPYFVLDAVGSYKVDVTGIGFVGLKAQVNNVLNRLFTTYVEDGSGYFVAATRNYFAKIEIGKSF